MITDVLMDHAALVPVVLGVVALVCAGAGHAAVRSRRSGRPVLWTLATLSGLLVLGLTLVPAGRGGQAVTCTAQFTLPSLTRVELLANVALFLPPVLFATLAARRPVVVAAVAAAASAAIEALQAVVPAIGRACDTNDWVMNALGILAGALLAAGILALAHRASPGSVPARRGASSADGFLRSPPPAPAAHLGAERPDHR